MINKNTKSLADNERIFVLMGTYNGARFVKEQLRSIQEQTVRNWTLLVRDDGSQDNTRHILEDFARNDRRIVCVEDDRGRLGAIGNYEALMRAALEQGAEIVLFSDQDDVWLPSKMADQLARLKELEQMYGTHMPLLVYSDLAVVDEELRTIHQSFMHYQGLAHETETPLLVLLAQNFVTGCATVVNRALLDLAVPVPDGAIMHDWWLALCAAACGRIDFMERPTLLYRQHAGNWIGAKNWWMMVNPFTVDVLSKWRASRRTLLGTIVQARELSQRIHERRTQDVGDAASLAQRYASSPGDGPMRRIGTVYQMGIHKQGFARQFGFGLLLLLLPRSLTVR